MTEPERHRLRVRATAGAAVVLVLAGIACAVIVAAVAPGPGATRTVAPADSGSAAADAGAGAAEAERPGAGEPSPAPVFVHVLGAVAHPGLYELTEGARVVDAIAAAGGLAEGADEGQVNLARRVDDGEQIAVPLVGQVPPPGAAPSGAGHPGRIDINTADAAALDTLPGIGPALAKRIVDWRAKNGRFATVDDLLDVPGIGQKVLGDVRDLVTT